MQFYKLDELSSKLSFSELGDGHIGKNNFKLLKHDFHPALIFDFGEEIGMLSVTVQDLAQEVLNTYKTSQGQENK